MAQTILQVIPTLDTGGAEMTTVEITAGLTAKGDRAFIASEGGQLVKQIEELGGEFVQLPVASKNPFRILQNGFLLAKLIRKENVDIIHVRSRAPAWSSLLASKLTKCPMVATFHGAYSSKGALKTFYNSVMVRGDAVIANSRFTAGRISRLHGDQGRKMNIIYRGILPSHFDEKLIDQNRIEKLRSDWQLTKSEEQKIILLPGRLTRQKGQLVAIKALNLLIKNSNIDARLICVGGDQGRTSYVNELKQLVNQLNLPNNVSFVGHCSDMPAAYCLADCVLVPSTEPEGFGRTAVEAQAAGIPVVASDIGAIAETVIDTTDAGEAGFTGWRVEPGNPFKLAEALTEALSLPEKEKQELAGRARRNVHSKFTLDKMVKDTLALYKHLIEPI